MVLEDEAEDRYGRVTGTATIQGEEKSVEEKLLREGSAFVYPVLDDERLDAYCESEREVRLGKRGFWADSKDVPAAEAKKLYRKYGFVAGTVSKTERVKNKVFLSFGAQDLPDFMVVIAARHLRALKKRGMDPLLLAGKTLRIRGWVGGDTVPAIILTDPHQIEGVE